jgi:hypothetical protein
MRRSNRARIDRHVLRLVRSLARAYWNTATFCYSAEKTNWRILVFDVTSGPRDWVAENESSWPPNLAVN